MPKFFFHLADGSREPDRTGVDLPGREQARLAAVAYAGELLKAEPRTLWEKGHWRVEVTEESGVLLFTVVTLAIDAPPPARQDVGDGVGAPDAFGLHHG